MRIYNRVCHECKSKFVCYERFHYRCKRCTIDIIRKLINENITLWLNIYVDNLKNIYPDVKEEELAEVTALIL